MTYTDTAKEAATKAAYNKKYREAHREKLKAYLKEYRTKNREKLAAKAKVNYYENHQAMLDAAKAYRAANPDKILAARKAYAETHREQIRERTNARAKTRRKENATYSRVYYRANREEVLKKGRVYNKKNAWRHRRNMLKREYGITPEQYNSMLDEQAFICAICGAPEFSSRHKTHLHVDHCHESGTVRLLLCSGCNTAIGLLKDDPALLRRAATYVEFFNYAMDTDQCPTQTKSRKPQVRNATENATRNG